MVQNTKNYTKSVRTFENRNYLITYDLYLLYYNRIIKINSFLVILTPKCDIDHFNNFLFKIYLNTVRYLKKK